MNKVTVDYTRYTTSKGGAYSSVGARVTFEASDDTLSDIIHEVAADHYRHDVWDMACEADAAVNAIMTERARAFEALASGLPEPPVSN